MALSKLPAEIIGVRSMALEWEVIKEGCACQLYADASAALSIAKWQGAGEMRHINARTLWLREKAVQKVIKYQKVRGGDNPADGLTKHVRQELAQQYARSTRTRLGSDRADISLKLADGPKVFLSNVPVGTVYVSCLAVYPSSQWM